MLRRYNVKGCVGKIVEYYGPGVATLSATDRETIGNMGAETGRHEQHLPFRRADPGIPRGPGPRLGWRELSADEGAPYDEELDARPRAIEPLIAKPTSPGNVVPVREVAGTRVDQVIVGSSVNSSFRDLMVSAKILEGRHVHPDTSFPCEPRQPPGARKHRPGEAGCWLFLSRRPRA